MKIGSNSWSGWSPSVAAMSWACGVWPGSQGKGGHIPGQKDIGRKIEKHKEALAAECHLCLPDLDFSCGLGATFLGAWHLLGLKSHCWSSRYSRCCQSSLLLLTSWPAPSSTPCLSHSQVWGPCSN